jgi:hypothetical protein
MMSEVSRDHWLGDQVAYEALVRFTDEELKHQEMFRRIDALCAEGMPAGYTFLPQPNDVAGVVLGKPTWSVLALICHIELFVLAHYRQAIEPDAELSELWKDVFTFHAREESQHAVLDELEWQREDAKLDAEQRDRAVDELIALVAAVDGMLQVQARADTDYFLRVAGCRGRALPEDPRRHDHGGAVRAHWCRARADHGLALSTVGTRYAPRVIRAARITPALSSRAPPG